jgi:hypothetical protein
MSYTVTVSAPRITVSVLLSRRAINVRSAARAVARATVEVRTVSGSVPTTSSDRVKRCIARTVKE